MLVGRHKHVRMTTLHN